jgi:hypothetical protein
MGIEHLKIWHWCILGILAGAGVGYAKLSAGVPEPTGLEPANLNVLEDYVLTGSGPERRPFYEIRNVRTHPGNPSDFDGEPYITYDLLVEHIEKPKPGEKKPANKSPSDKRQADVLPRIARLSAPGPKKHALTYLRDRKMAEKLERLHASIIADHLNVSQYLDKLNEIVNEAKKAGGRYADATPLQYKFNWWEAPKATYWMYTSGGFLIVGLIFPTILQLLTIAGYGRAPKEKDESDLANYKGRPEPAASKPAVPLNEKEQLAALEAELEAKLKAGATDNDTAAAPAAAPAKPVIAKLTAGKLEQPKEADAAATPARKGFGADHGDYYPTEVHGKKK